MPQNRKYYIHNNTHLITARTEEGLPFVPTHFLNLIIWGILAKARTLYQVKVCHFVFMANHFHMLLVVDNPEHTSSFVGYVKCETAHAVNKLLGRQKKTIWCDGYDSPVLLTDYDIIRYIKYIYQNPARANLVEHIGEYPGVSSWNMYKNSSTEKLCATVSRDSIIPLELPALSINEQKRLTEQYSRISTRSEKFTLEPDAWMGNRYAAEVREEINARIRSEIQEAELKMRTERMLNKRTVIGSTALQRQSMDKYYIPSKFSQRMICISSDRGMRGYFIQQFKELCNIAYDIYQQWKIGDFSSKLPPGFLPPRIPTLMSAVP